MKAIYINIDEYIQPVVDWIKGGRIGPIPKPGYVLPVSVTIPLGQSAAVFAPGKWAPEEEYGEVIVCSVDGDRISARAVPSNVPEPEESTPIDYGCVPGFSKIGPEMEYAVWAETGNFTLFVEIMDLDTDEQEEFTVAIPVIVNRETASGPVDLVDFTPPASAIAAGTDLKGATFDGNEIVAAAETGALSAPAGA
jgi:hypothetical protein